MYPERVKLRANQSSRGRYYDRARIPETNTYHSAPYYIGGLTIAKDVGKTDWTDQTKLQFQADIELALKDTTNQGDVIVATPFQAGSTNNTESGRDNVFVDEASKCKESDTVTSTLVILKLPKLQG
ncbi:hypothetical protein MMC14_006865 [Varicellaria rhodocarpa]|nr:hypothetical protein [Varicellaria rhodocarpa]